MVKVPVQLFLILISFSIHHEHMVESPMFLRHLDDDEPVDCHEQKYQPTCILLNCFWHDKRGCLFKNEVTCSDAHSSAACSTLNHCFWDNHDKKCREKEEVECSKQNNKSDCSRFPQCYWDSEDEKCRERDDDVIPTMK